MQKTNCPMCNEPIGRTVLRSDFVPRGAGVAARCSGQSGVGETLDLEITRDGWLKEQEGFRDFESKRAEERQTVVQT